MRVDKIGDVTYAKDSQVFKDCDVIKIMIRMFKHIRVLQYTCVYRI